jgi:hypothetical protein
VTALRAAALPVVLAITAGAEFLARLARGIR